MPLERVHSVLSLSHVINRKSTNIRLFNRYLFNIRIVVFKSILNQKEDTNASLKGLRRNPVRPNLKPMEMALQMSIYKSMPFLKGRALWVPSGNRATSSGCRNLDSLN